MGRRNSKSPSGNSKNHKEPKETSIKKSKKQYETEDLSSDEEEEMEIQSKKSAKRDGTPKPSKRKIDRIIERKSLNANVKKLNKNQKAKLRKQTLKRKFVDDGESDVECASRTFARENDDLSEEEESEEEEDVPQMIQDQNDSEENFCQICKNQNIPKDNKKHKSVHLKSIFILNWLSENYKKCDDKKKFFCDKCFQQDQAKNAKSKKKINLDEKKYWIDVKSTMKHLFEVHVEEFRGHEKEFLKQIDFFKMVGRNRKHFNEVVDEFEFNFSNLKEYSKIFYSKTIEHNHKKRLLWGEMSHRLLKILKENQFPGKPNKMTQKLIDEYLLQGSQSALSTPNKSSIGKQSTRKDGEKEKEDNVSQRPVNMPENSVISPDRVSQDSNKRMGEDISQEDVIVKKVKEERDTYYAGVISKMVVERYQKEDEHQKIVTEYKQRIESLEKELAKLKQKVETE